MPLIRGLLRITPAQPMQKKRKRAPGGSGSDRTRLANRNPEFLLRACVC